MRLKFGMLFLVLALSLVAARPTLIILDASGSMGDYMDSGMTKMEAAKIAAKNLVDDANEPLALMVYTNCDSGGDPYSGANSLVVDFTTDKQTLKSEIDRMQPTSATPISDAIKEGAQFVADSGGGIGVILLTDGEETCTSISAPELAQIADDNGVEIINIVGFQLDPQAEQQMQDVAQSTGGQYYEATDLETLQQSLQEAYQSSSDTSLLSLNCCPTPAFALLLIGAFALYRKE
jgi:Ca-activated chloride channel family protein